MDDKLENNIRCFFEYIFHTKEKSICKDKLSVDYNCPCCNYPTLSERGAYHICYICLWEDDGQDEPYCNEVWHGANKDYSLTEARNNFSEYLIYYRPSDEKVFKKNKEKNHLRKEIIDKYQQLKNTKDLSIIKSLKKDIEELKKKLS